MRLRHIVENPDIAAWYAAELNDESFPKSELPESEFSDYVDPNDILEALPLFAFIYTGDKLFTSQYKHDTHTNIVEQNAEYFGLKHGQGHRTYSVVRIRTCDLYLYGRYGATDNINNDCLSFWNDKASTYDRLLDGCMNELADMISQDAIISTPLGNTTVRAYKTLLNNSRTAVDTSEQLAVHLMRPDQKRAALMAMGAKGGVKSQMQQAAEREKLVMPGQKWWAPTSESRRY